MRPHSLFLLGCAALVAGCNYTAPHFAASGSSGPTAWIDQPLEGDVVELGSTVPIRWHATDPNGIRQVEIWINGATLETFVDLDPDAQLVTADMTWNPSEAGQYRIEVIATNLDGVVGPSATKRLTVTAPSAVTDTLVPSPTATFLPSSTPSPTNTSTPNLPPPPVTVPVLPIATTIVPTDDVPPPKPQIISPDGELVGCLEDIVLRWNAVTDSSGIDYYEVVLKVNTGGANFSTVGTWQVESFTALNVNQQTDCGSTYGWTVRARDNAGNWGPLDAALFGIDLP